ncbi:hypothetical protein [Neogemmobacter tilapiae]|uniref:EF-hand domain-containing protein n=1 Tax=Neogemmobacter tilapiae TaxID=875041 RepID=A0A918TWP4_9RHOB|nr:hypothetical protein [Gemmobacter tilapiae]GHC62248.1 hypothetical protein GCM10007315_27870 [Gemmobacter tilapiae]
MRKSFAGSLLVLAMLAGGVQAEGALPGDLPEKMLKRMREAPEAFVADAADLILGYGQGGAITPEGIAEAITVERAAARAQAYRRLMEADLDGDGAASGEEMAVLIRAEGAEGRGRLALGYAAADGDGNGVLEPGEMQAQAQAAGDKAVSAAKEAALMALMGLDMNGDGGLTLAEVQAAVELAGDKS